MISFILYVTGHYTPSNFTVGASFFMISLLFIAIGLEADKHGA